MSDGPGRPEPRGDAIGWALFVLALCVAVGAVIFAAVLA